MTRVEFLIQSLGLQPHPEGGWYREVFRSAHGVRPSDGRGTRHALTTIYFLLPEGSSSRLHRVLSDEAWHFYEGGPLRLTTCEGDFTEVRHVVLGALTNSSQPVHVVRAGCWQAAAPVEEYTLVGCTVGPGFDFADFAMLRDDANLAERFRQAHPELRALL